MIIRLAKMMILAREINISHETGDLFTTLSEAGMVPIVDFVGY
jgi:hypothetical protein